MIVTSGSVIASRVPQASGLVSSVGQGRRRCLDVTCRLSDLAIAGLIGWFVSPGVALLIFLVFPVLYVVRVRSADW
jgi:hypothetical protein